MKSIAFTSIMLMMLVTQAQDLFTTSKKKEEIITKSLKWEYGGYVFTNSLSFRRSDFNYYKGLSKSQPCNQFTIDHFDHPYLLNIAKVLDEDAKTLGYTGYVLAEYLVAFVQSIPYINDPFNNGYDYPRYGIETVIEGGDCEDKTYLLVSMLNTFGFDALLVSLPGHMAAAISCGNCDGYYIYNGKKYSFIETTQPGWKIGSIPEHNRNTPATLIEVPRPSIYYRGMSIINSRYNVNKGLLLNETSDTSNKWSFKMYFPDIRGSPNIML